MYLAIFGTLIEYFQKGGFVMWPLLLCSIIGVAFVIERGIYYHRLPMDINLLFTYVRDKLLRKDLKGAMDDASQYGGPLGNIIKAGLLRFGRNHEEILRAIESVALHEVSKLERGLWVLATIANIAPILGFLGTVTGMINSFKVLSLQSFTDPRLVAAGISQALITTATGLIIAFPIQFAYNYFSNKLNNFTLLMETSAAMLLEIFSEMEEEKEEK